MTTSILIVAAGRGERFGKPKHDLPLVGKSLLERCREVIATLPFEHELIIVPPENGGATRFESVKRGLKQCNGEIVLIHNVANPLVSADDFVRVRDELLKQDAAIFAGQPVSDTLRRMGSEKIETIDRDQVWRVQTPQGFRRGTLLRLIEQTSRADVSDEVILYEEAGLPIVSIPTSPMNFKITYPEDLELAEQILAGELKAGIGEDSHAFDSGGELTLAGVKIPALPKLKGNSDGDVILHALFNAISSALGKGSLGPTGDPMAEQGIVDSPAYLRVILKEAQESGWRVNNISVSLECSLPKIDPLVPELKKSLSALLEIDEGRVGITATSGEALSPFGKGEGIRCTCMVSLRSIAH